MTESGVVRVAPIRDVDVPEVGRFLHAHLNSRLSSVEWAQSILPTWTIDSPNHGFLLRADQGDTHGEVVGVQLAFYSRREVEGRLADFCNLGAWCVLEPFRGHGLRLLRTVLAQRGYHFTDLSPSGNVIALNRRLGFEVLDSDTALVPHRPLALARATRILSDHREIEQHISGHDRVIFWDHRDASAAIHLLVVGESTHSYVIVRRERRRGLPVFASLLHVGNPAFLRANLGVLGSYLLRRHGLVATLLEVRMLGIVPTWSYRLRQPRPKMFRSARGTAIPADAVDNLYSELALVAW